MQLFVRAVELQSYDGSRSTTRIVPSKSGLRDRKNATDEPMIAPPAITTS